MHNIHTGSFSGKLYAVNPKEEQVQGLVSYKDVSGLPETDLAFLAIPAAFCLEAVRELAEKKKTRAFVIVSAGFSEENEEGAAIEKEIARICKLHNAALIGPNCIGVLTPAYQGIFTMPIPRLDPSGCDFISGSGATAVFIMESGLQKGLKFNHVFSVGNSALMGVEDVLAHLDETYEEGSSSRVKILYFESIRKPQMLLRHASSLIRKGCRIAAIKAGTSDAGSRAASSHTGAMANPDMAVDALFRKAGIIRCHGREELTTVASVMLYPPLKGKNLAIITHAGGPAVMLTDCLASAGMDVPELSGPKAEELLTHLFPGSSVSNPIDLLATGNAEQVGRAIDFCEHHFTEINGIVVIFGTPGLYPVFDVYRIMHEKMTMYSKPIFPVLPSITTAAEEVREFLSMGHINFPDEVEFGKALGRVYNSPAPAEMSTVERNPDVQVLRGLIEQSADGYMNAGQVQAFLDAAGIPRVEEGLAGDKSEAEELAGRLGYPLAMKIVGPVHKSDVGGVVLDIRDVDGLMEAFSAMEKIEGFEAVLLQPMMEGLEVFLGASYEPSFGHMVLCGMGGILVELMKDVASGLAPLTFEESMRMISSLKGYRILEGVRGQEGISISALATLISKLSMVLMHTPEIKELDINPILGKGDSLIAVDARIRIEK